MQGYIIGVDIGTGSAKAVAVDPYGNIIGRTQYSYPTIIGEGAKQEQDPEALWNAFLSCIKELILELKNLPTSVSLSSAMHSIMAVNQEGKPISNLIIWSDGRSKEIAQKLRNEKEGLSIYNATGTPIHAMSPLCKIIWWRENERAIFTKAHKFISIKEFIWYRLFNEYTIDHSIASATGLFNIDTLKWNSESLEKAQITTEQVSTPVPTDYHRNGISMEACKLSGLNPLTPVCIGASDGCLANLGTNSLNIGVAAITIGTSGAVRIASRVPIRNNATMSFNYILDSQNFICGGPINNGGNVMEWLIRNFLDNEDLGIDPYSSIFNMIHKIPAGSEGLIFLPYIFAERAPVWDEESSGVFMGIKHTHSKAHFISSIIEGVCFALKEVLELIELASCGINEIHASGAFIKSNGWVQLLADVTGKPIVIVETDDASAIGAAFMAYRSLGIIKDLNEIKHQRRLVIPDKSKVQEYSKFFTVYKTMYSGLQHSMHLLYKTITT
jgi:gluconokinase